MDEFFKLERRIEPFAGDDCIFDNFSKCLEEYGVPELEHLLVRHYSKLDAVNRHTEDLTPDMARAILTDRGLLFAQTRERSYPIEHSRRLLDSTRDEHEGGETNLRLNEETVNDIVVSVHNSCRRVLPKLVSEDGLDEKLVKFDIMLRKILSMCSSLDHIGSKLYYTDEDPGFVKGRSIEEKTAWTYTVKLHFPKRQKQVGAAKWLRKNNAEPVSDEEMFLFLAYALPGAVYEAKKIDKSHRLSKAADRKTPMVIDRHQREKLDEQIEAFRQRDSYCDVLLSWKGAGKLLHSYVSCAEDRFKISSKSENDMADFSNLGDCYDLFAASFKKYFHAIEARPEEEGEEKIDLPSRLADFFLRVTSDGRKPLFIDQPLTIYRLARSPVHRAVCKANRVKVPQMVQSSSSVISFPILKKFLDAEADLYGGIVDACAIGCEHFQIDFDEGSWRDLWDCIEQSVNCLSYDFEDLLSVGWFFQSGYSDFRHFYPILDQWIRDRISDTDNPFEPVLWRRIQKAPKRLVKVMKDGTRDKVDFEKDILSAYRKIFTSATPNIDRLMNILNTLAKCFGWNNITRLPTVDELARAEERLPIKLKKCSREQLEHYVEIVCFALSEEDDVDVTCDRNAVKEIQLVMTEWVFCSRFATKRSSTFLGRLIKPSMGTMNALDDRNVGNVGFPTFPTKLQYQ